MSLLVQHISMPIETETNAGVVCLQREAWWTLLFRMSNVFIYFQKQEKGSIFPRNRNSLLKMDTEMKSSMMYLQPFIYPFLQMKFILGHHRMNLQWFHSSVWFHVALLIVQYDSAFRMERGRRRRNIETCTPSHYP